MFDIVSNNMHMWCMQPEKVILDGKEQVFGRVCVERNWEVAVGGSYRQLAAVENDVFGGGSVGNGLVKQSLQLLRIFGV
jgi:hypothetical protein